MPKNKKKTEQTSKKRFEVEEGETIDACLERIKQAGFTPIRRTEKPIFKEKTPGDKESVEPVARQIIFDAVVTKDEH
ncbi:hypothetical protein GCM10011351_14060 [Paraliobacillus quinghaiensis]|uniref:NETI motif-containing protein n=1 Tax=Paraliobacillus quinghaiensis TaxID=470815 RepID=A0A917WUJ4_9BACI|nr:NETI motif-containing protein [Paraliobacillus quinghaiensis]GGM29202.1 hypothetical protein GCM10011351_14060 [Paraliobacillus quinghaiensis]